MILCFFGFEIFHFDLHVLIHPSGGDLFLHNLTSTAPSQVVELASTSGVPLLSTTSLAAVLPFRSPPELDPGGPFGPIWAYIAYIGLESRV